MKLSSSFIALIASSVAVSAGSISSQVAAGTSLNALAFNRNNYVAASSQTGLTCKPNGSLGSASSGTGAGVGVGAGAGAGTGAGVGVSVGVPSIISGLHGSLSNACSPLLKGDEKTITPAVLASVQANIIAALTSASGQCGSLKAKGSLVINYSDSIAIAAELSSVFQVIASSFSKVTCGCVANELAVALAEIDLHLSTLSQTIFSLAGSLSTSVSTNVVGLAKESGSLTAFKSYGFKKTLKTCHAN